MKIKSIYSSVLKSKRWNYYNQEFEELIISDTNSCDKFIRSYMNYAGKSKTVLLGGIDYLKEQCPQRLTHIVSTFLLGIWFYRNSVSVIKKFIRKELNSLSCFQNNMCNVDLQFAYVWFMATLYHDLGYKAENALNGESLPSYAIGELTRLSVPSFYKDVFNDYYNYRNKKEHGIYAGFQFDKDICNIRRFQEHTNSELNWNENLEELYHYVAWIILSHNIWMIRDDNKEVEKYKENGLEKLILSSDKYDSGQFKEYKIKFDEYPLFTLFCIIDTIEPTKNTSCLSDVRFKLSKDKIVVESNDSTYRNKVFSLKSWLTPVDMDNTTCIINLNY